MKYEFFDADQRHEFDPQRLTRFATREAWAMSRQDFAVEAALLFGRGAAVRNDGRWPAGNRLVDAAAGWMRVVMPGGFDRVLGRQPDAVVSVTPDGTIFLDGGNHLDRKVGILDMVAYLAMCSASAGARA